MATFTVTNLFDSGAGSLRDAIFQANSSAGLDEINFDLSLSGGTIDLTGGELAIADSLNITGLGANALTIEGTTPSRVFSLTGTSSNYLDVSISGLKITGGNGGFEGGLASGSGIYSHYTNLNLTNAIVAGNRTSTLTSVGGGAIYNDFGSLNLTGSSILNNSAGYGSGGGIYNLSGTVNINSSTFSENAAYTQGGAIYNSSGTVNIIDSIFSKNVSQPNGTGGAIYNDSSGTVNLTSSNVSDNYATFVGGGILNAGVLNVNDSTIEGNTSESGGGIFNYGILNLKNSTISGNEAFSRGGGISNTNALGGGVVTIANSQISGNIAPEGSDIYNAGGSVSVPEGDTILGTILLVLMSVPIYYRQRRAAIARLKVETQLNR